LRTEKVAEALGELAADRRTRPQLCCTQSLCFHRLEFAEQRDLLATCPEQHDTLAELHNEECASVTERQTIENK
jgi:hypothetical protein